MKKRVQQGIAVMVCVLLISVAGFAQTKVSFTVPNYKWMGVEGDGYNPFDETEFLDIVYFEVTPIQFSGNFFIGFSKGSAGSYNRTAKNLGHTLRYQIYGSKNRQHSLKNVPDLTRSNEVLSGTINSTGLSVQRLGFYISVPANQVVYPGIYRDTITLNFYSGDFTTGLVQPIESVEIPIKFKVKEVMELSVDINNYKDIGTFNFKLDTLEEGVSQKYDVYVRSNRDYYLLIQSDNKGHLRHKIPRAQTTVKYLCYIDTQKVDVTGDVPSRIMRPKNRKTAIEDVYQVKMIVGKTSHAFKGQYYDRIQFTLEPVE